MTKAGVVAALWALVACGGARVDPPLPRGAGAGASPLASTSGALASSSPTAQTPTSSRSAPGVAWWPTLAAVDAWVHRGQLLVVEAAPLRLSVYDLAEGALRVRAPFGADLEASAHFDLLGDERVLVSVGRAALLVDLAHAKVAPRSLEDAGRHRFHVTRRGGACVAQWDCGARLLDCRTAEWIGPRLEGSAIEFEVEDGDGHQCLLQVAPLGEAHGKVWLAGSGLSTTAAISSSEALMDVDLSSGAVGKVSALPAGLRPGARSTLGPNGDVAAIFSGPNVRLIDLATRLEPTGPNAKTKLAAAQSWSPIEPATPSVFESQTRGEALELRQRGGVEPLVVLAQRAWLIGEHALADRLVGVILVPRGRRGADVRVFTAPRGPAPSAP